MRTRSWRAAAGLTLVLVAHTAAHATVRGGESTQPSSESGSSRQAAPAAGQPAAPPAIAVAMTAEQVRARFEAAQVAGRPITFAQGAAGAAIVGVVASVVGWSWVTRPARVVRELAVRATDAETTGLLSVGAPSPLGWAVLVACACVLLLTPIAVLLALSDE